MSEDKTPQGPNPWMKSLAIWLGILLAIVLFVSMFESGSRQPAGESIAYSEFLSRVDDGSVREADIGNGVIAGKYSNGATFKTFAPNDPGLISRLTAKNVTFRARPEEQPSVWTYLLYQSFPFLILLGIGYFVMRQMQKNAGSGAMGFGKSRAKMLTEKQGRVTFDDVAGIDEAREELQESSTS
jgi:cell division protease FtsH